MRAVAAKKTNVGFSALSVVLPMMCSVLWPMVPRKNSSIVASLRVYTVPAVAAAVATPRVPVFGCCKSFRLELWLAYKNTHAAHTVRPSESIVQAIAIQLTRAPESIQI